MPIAAMKHAGYHLYTPAAHADVHPASRTPGLVCFVTKACNIFTPHTSTSDISMWYPRPQSLMLGYYTPRMHALAVHCMRPLAGAYTLREEALQRREAEGDISFAYVLNDDTARNLIYLTGLKNIYGKQLPNMPKEYIVRLVMDRRHRSVALIKRNGTVIGGITYRCAVAMPSTLTAQACACSICSHLCKVQSNVAARRACFAGQ